MTTQSLQKLEECLKEMVGKTYLVNAVTHTILSFRIDNDKLLVVSDKKWFPSIDVQHSALFLETFLETEEEGPVDSLPATVIPKPEVLQISGTLKEVLLANIKKIQEDKAYIPQAAEIGNQVKTLIDLAKTEIAYNRLLRGQ